MKNSQMHLDKDLEKEWFVCPYCGKKLAMIDKDSKVEKVFIKCTRCKNEIEITNK